MIELLQSIPAALRQRIYFTYIALAFLLGGVNVALSAAGVDDPPIWFIVAGEVLKYASVPILAVAGVNVTTSSAPAPAPDWPDQEVNPLAGRRIPPGRGKHRADVPPEEE